MIKYKKRFLETGKEEKYTNKTWEGTIDKEKCI